MSLVPETYVVDQVLASNKIFTEDNGNLDLPTGFARHRMDESKRCMVDSIIISPK